MLSARRYLDGGADMEDVATLLVEAAGTLSIQTPVREGIDFTTRVLALEVVGRLLKRATTEELAAAVKKKFSLMMSNF